MSQPYIRTAPNDLNIQQYCCAGLNFGYFYDQSPVMVYDEESAPDYSMGSFTASTVPGCRAPHFWLEQDTSLYDALGAAYTLLCFKPECDAEVSAVQKAAGEANMPLKILDVSAYTDRPREYSHHFAIVRADAHTVWRGDQLYAENAKQIVTKLCGYSTPSI